MLKRKQQTGFTIVELLIVIVVIAILAAITIIAFNGIQNRAKVTSIKSDLSQAYKQIAINKINNGGTYQADGSGLPKSSSTYYQYRSDGATFCLSATSNGVSDTFHIDNTTSTIQSGVCDGDSANPSGPSMTGGAATTVQSGGSTYKVLTFTSSGTLNVSNGGTVEYLVVAGGGAGGTNTYAGGGGGAGGFLSGSKKLDPGSYAITVGIGGSSAGANGQNSSFDSFATAIGGGGGSNTGDGNSGGSGGGGYARGNSGGNGTSSQGNGGGSSTSSAAGGGGGAGSSGGSGSDSNCVAGNGGDGKEWPSGSGNYYAAGGGGGGNGGGAGRISSQGGNGGGGSGSCGSTNAVSGTANTGSGGGGTRNGTIGQGGSGIVIIRYVMN